MHLDDFGKIVLTKDTVQLKPYVARSPKQFQLMSDQELFDNIGSDMVCDTETYPNYHLTAFKHIKTGKIVKFELGEGRDFNSRKLTWLLHNYRVITFNGIKYDFPIIWLAITHKSVAMLKRASDKIILENVFWRELLKEFDYKIYETAHIDTIEVCPLTGGLKTYGARLHGQRLQDLPFDIHSHLTEEEIEIVADYCVNDLDLTELCYVNLAEQFKLRSELSKQYNIDLMSKSDAQIAEAIISAELKKINGRYPTKPKIQPGSIYNYDVPDFISFKTPELQRALGKIAKASFQVMDTGRVIIPDDIGALRLNIGKGVYRLGNGGLHSSETCAAVKADENHDLYDRDVASYYPAIVLRLGLYPEHLGPEFLTVYKAIIDRRLAAKKAKNIIVSEGLKITINGTFGKLGSPYSILSAPKLLSQVTITGQLCLLMLIEKLELEGIPVASANTDGIMIKCPKDKKELMLNIIKMWESFTGFTTEETEYQAIYSRDVNAYLAVKKEKDGKVEIKGKNIFYDPWQVKNDRDKIWRFFKNPQAQICTEAIEKCISQGTPIEQTIRNSTDITRFVSVKNVKGGGHKDGEYLGKVVRWYIARGVTGTINYITNNHIVGDTEGAKPCMDLPETFPVDVNYDWYINRANEMLEDLGYKPKKEQLKFW